jgi:hypothetical protein
LAWRREGKLDSWYLFPAEANMKQLFVSVVCLMLALNQPGYAQSAAASKAPAQGASPPPPRPRHAAKRQAVEPTPAPKPRRDNATGANVKTKPVRPPVISYADALRRCRGERHDRVWWRSRFTTIVFVTGGYYYWDAGYWFPALGYDPLYDYYEYNGPIYTYGNLLPDQVIINVQRALQQLGYYAGGLTGSLGTSTRAALAAYQQDAGLPVTGAIDAPTVEALGLY